MIISCEIQYHLINYIVFLAPICASSAQDNNICVPHQPWITISCPISAVCCQALESKFSSHSSRYFRGKLLASTPIALVLQQWVRSSPCVYKSICKANKMSLYCHLPSSLTAWKRGERKKQWYIYISYIIYGHICLWKTLNESEKVVLTRWFQIPPQGGLGATLLVRGAHMQLPATPHQHKDAAILGSENEKSTSARSVVILFI